MTERIPFGKHYTEEQSLITLLQSRGLSITDVNKANHNLTHIGYYRLSAYMYPLLRVPKEQHLYKPGATFSKVMMLYRFDKKLRLLLFNEIEKIEVAVRSAIVKHGCEVTGDPFWMTNPNNSNIIVKPWINLPTDTLRIYFDMCIIKYFLNIISPGNDMLDKMQALFAEYPEVDLGALGFPSGNWQEEPLWSTR